MKRNKKKKPRPGFELASPIPFPTTINVIPSVLLTLWHEVNEQYAIFIRENVILWFSPLTALKVSFNENFNFCNVVICFDEHDLTHRSSFKFICSSVNID